MPKYKLRIYEDFSERLNYYTNWYYSKGGIHLADDFTIEILQCLNIIESNPYIASNFGDLNTKKYVVQKYPLLIFYEISSNQNNIVDVVALIHQKQNYQ